MSGYKGNKAGKKLVTNQETIKIERQLDNNKVANDAHDAPQITNYNNVNDIGNTTGGFVEANDTKKQDVSASDQSLTFTIESVTDLKGNKTDDIAVRFNDTNGTTKQTISTSDQSLTLAYLYNASSYKSNTRAARINMSVLAVNGSKRNISLDLFVNGSGQLTTKKGDEEQRISVKAGVGGVVLVAVIFGWIIKFSQKGKKDPVVIKANIKKDNPGNGGDKPKDDNKSNEDDSGKSTITDKETDFFLPADIPHAVFSGGKHDKPSTIVSEFKELRLPQKCRIRGVEVTTNNAPSNQQVVLIPDVNPNDDHVNDANNVNLIEWIARWLHNAKGLNQQRSHPKVLDSILLTLEQVQSGSSNLQIPYEMGFFSKQFISFMSDNPQLCRQFYSQLLKILGISNLQPKSLQQLDSIQPIYQQQLINTDTNNVTLVRLYPNALVFMELNQQSQPTIVSIIGFNQQWQPTMVSIIGLNQQSQPTVVSVGVNLQLCGEFWPQVQQWLKASNMQFINQIGFLHQFYQPLMIDPNDLMMNLIDPILIHDLNQAKCCLEWDCLRKKSGVEQSYKQFIKNMFAFYTNHRSTLRQYVDYVNEIRQDNEALIQEIERNEREIALFNIELNDLRKENAELKSANQDNYELQLIIAHLDEEVKRYNEIIQDLEKDNRVSSGKIAIFEEKYIVCNQQYVSQVVQCREGQKTLKELQQQIIELKLENIKLKCEMFPKDQQIFAIQRVDATNRISINILKQDNRRLQKTSKKLQQTNRELQQTNWELYQTNGGLEEQVGLDVYRKKVASDNLQRIILGIDEPSEKSGDAQIRDAKRKPSIKKQCKDIQGILAGRPAKSKVENQLLYSSVVELGDDQLSDLTVSFIKLETLREEETQTALKKNAETQTEPQKQTIETQVELNKNAETQTELQQNVKKQKYWFVVPEIGNATTKNYQANNNVKKQTGGNSTASYCFVVFKS